MRACGGYACACAEQERWDTAKRSDSIADVVDRARAYLAAMPAAISGQGGHNDTFKAAIALVWGFALDEGVALDLLMADYNPRCEPQWERKDLLHKVQQAAKVSHDRPRGHLLSAGDRPVAGGRRGRRQPPPKRQGRDQQQQRDWRATARRGLAALGGLPARVDDWPDDWREAFEERAGIMEFDGGLAKADAERRAEQRIRADHARGAGR